MGDSNDVIGVILKSQPFDEHDCTLVHVIEGLAIFGMSMLVDDL
jgi:hypothetical protein